jgi:hypothetical protein
MIFPKEDIQWMEALDFINKYVLAYENVYAPSEFLQYHALTYPLNYLGKEDLPLADWVVFHKGWIHHLNPEAVRQLKQTHQSLWCNKAFIIFCRRSPWSWLKTFINSFYQNKLPLAELKNETQLLRRHRALVTREKSKSLETAILVTTYNRPWALARSLPQILLLGAPVLVVNDGSDPCHKNEYQDVYHRNHCEALEILELPTNRGLSAAMNIGLSYLLARPRVVWISYLQDDVDVDPDLLLHLQQVRHPSINPVLSGFLSKEHPTLFKNEHEGHILHYRFSNPGVHIDAHRSYWEQIIPIPSLSLAAPKPGLPSNEDWWILSWSPYSVAKTGRYVVCLPDLVKTFATEVHQSTWGNSGE